MGLPMLMLMRNVGDVLHVVGTAYSSKFRIWRPEKKVTGKSNEKGKSAEIRSNDSPLNRQVRSEKEINLGKSIVTGRGMRARIMQCHRTKSLNTSEKNSRRWSIHFTITAHCNPLVQITWSISMSRTWSLQYHMPPPLNFYTGRVILSALAFDKCTYMPEKLIWTDFSAENDLIVFDEQFIRNFIAQKIGPYWRPWRKWYCILSNENIG